MADSEKKPIYASQRQLYEMAVQKMNTDHVIIQHAYKIDNYRIAAAMFDEVGDYLDAPELAEECRRRIEDTKEDELAAIYRRSKDRINDPETYRDIDKVKKLEKQLTELSGYKDADSLLSDCRAFLKKKERRRKIRNRIILLFLLLIAGFTAAGVYTGYLKYMAGVAMMKYGKYGQAEEIFRSMPGYRDADEYVQQNEIRMLDTAAVGDKFFYGKFRWQVLSVKDDVLTLIPIDIDSEHLFYRVPFNESGKDTTWKDSSLRKWLNEEVCQQYFSDVEREYIVLQTSGVSVNEEYGTSYDEETKDYLSLLSIEEAQEYMDVLQTLGNDFWYRTPGNSMETVCVMSGGSHEIKTYGYPADDTGVAVRPILKVRRAAQN